MSEMDTFKRLDLSIIETLNDDALHQTEIVERLTGVQGPPAPQPQGE